VRVVVILLLLASTAAADPSLGSIRGRVIDKATGEPAVGSTVVAINVATQEHAVIADENGEYVIPELLPGSYTVVVYYLDAKTFRSAVDVGADQQPFVNLSVDHPNELSQVIRIDDIHMCCGGCPCHGPCGNTFEGVLGAASGGADAEVERTAPDVHRRQLGLSARGAIGLSLADGDSEPTASITVEATYGLTGRIELALAGGVDDRNRWHGAAGLRVFATKHLFVQPQLTLPFGMSLLEGVWFDVHRSLGVYAFAAQALDRDAGVLGAGAGVQARY
jgi:hypothetical protein